MELVSKIWYIFDKKQKIRLIELMILILVGTIMETLGVTAIIPFISAMLYPDKILDNQYAAMMYQMFHLQSVEEFIILISIGLMLLYILKNAYLCFMYSAQHRFIYNNQRRMGDKLLEVYMKEPYAFHLQHNSATLIHNINVDVISFYSIVLYTIGVVTDVLISISLIIVAVVTDPFIACSVAALLIVFIVLFYKRYKNMMKRQGEKTRYYGKKSTQSLQQAFGGIKEIKVLGREEYFVHSYDNHHKNVMSAKRKLVTYSMFPKPLMETICVVALLSVVSIKIVQGEDIASFITTLSVFALAVIKMLPSTSRITTNLNNIAFGKPSIDALYHDLKEAEELAANQKCNKGVEKEIVFEKEIEIENLYFKYENTDKYVLDGINMRIPKNKSVAFVGTSGAGKTTLADIILGVLQAEKGKILIDGVSINDNMKAWQCKIGYIPQNIFITDDTIRRNVAFAIEDDEIEDEKIWRALEEAQLKTFVEGLDEGLDAVIGERGARISGGQRQRIGIARALYHNPEVLVLDEATSALDNETEAAVMEAIHALNGRKTLIIIAHRLSTIENCSIVYRVENGKVLSEKRELV